MAEILLAGNEIRPLGIDTPFGHWQLVYTDNANLNEATFYWEIEVQAPDNVTFGNWLFPNLPRDHSDNTPNFGIQNRYDTTIIDTGGRSAESIWNIFTQVHQQFAAQGGGLDYDVNQNSNSYVNTLLYVVGLNLTTIRTGINIPEAGNFPGSNTNVLLGNRSNVVINLNIVGTDENDFIRTGIGNDTLDGGAGADRMEGGAGLDTYKGGFADSAYDDGTDGEKDVYDAFIGTINDADGSYGLNVSLPTFPFAFKSAAPTAAKFAFAGPSSTSTGSVTNNSALADLIKNGQLEIDYNLDGDMVLDFVAFGGSSTLSNFNWGDGDIHLNIAREEGSIVGGDAEGDTLRNIENLVGSSHDDTLTFYIPFGTTHLLASCTTAKAI